MHRKMFVPVVGPRTRKCRNGITLILVLLLCCLTSQAADQASLGNNPAKRAPVASVDELEQQAILLNPLQHNRASQVSVVAPRACFGCRSTEIPSWRWFAAPTRSYATRDGSWSSCALRCSRVRWASPAKQGRRHLIQRKVSAEGRAHTHAHGPRQLVWTRRQTPRFHVALLLRPAKDVCDPGGFQPRASTISSQARAEPAQERLWAPG